LNLYITKVLVDGSRFTIGFVSNDIPDVVTSIGPLLISKSLGTVILTVAPVKSGLLFCTISVTLLIVFIVIGSAVTSALEADPLTAINAYKLI
jgi:hypothetical protein